MSERPLSSRQYIAEAWQPFTVDMNGESVVCNLNYATEVDGDPALCVIPTQALNVVQEPVVMKEKPNVMSEWLDRLTAGGGSILLVHGEYYDDLYQLADEALEGKDGFDGMEKRLRYSIGYCLENGYASEGKVVVMGSSRHGFAILHSMAKNPAVSAAVAHQPVVYWPRMEEFAGREDDPLVRKHDLYNMIEDFAPRPIMIQTGYDDQRVGQEYYEKLITPMKKHYETVGAGDRFFHDLMPIPGHDGTPIPDSALDGVVPWLQSQGIM